MDDRSRATALAYDSAASDFAERTVARSAMAAEFFDLFMASLAPNSVVGDLGCGPGHDLRRLLAAGHRPFGLDSSAALLALGPTGSRRSQGDLRAIPLVADSLDAIWSSAALLHVARSDLTSTFAEWNRVLRPAGIVAFATSLGGDEGWELVPASRGRVPEISDGHQRWFVHHDQEALLAAVASVGWKITLSSVRQSTRRWLQITAAKPAAD